MQEGTGQYYVPLSHVDIKALMELALAVEDALLRYGCSEKTALRLSEARKVAEEALGTQTQPPTAGN